VAGGVAFLSALTLAGAAQADNYTVRGHTLGLCRERLKDLLWELQRHTQHQLKVHPKSTQQELKSIAGEGSLMEKYKARPLSITTIATKSHLPAMSCNVTPPHPPNFVCEPTNPQASQKGAKDSGSSARTSAIRERLAKDAANAPKTKAAPKAAPKMQPRSAASTAPKLQGRGAASPSLFTSKPAAPRPTMSKASSAASAGGGDAALSPAATQAAGVVVGLGVVAAGIRGFVVS
jgi:hypothetical protein